MKAAPFPPLNNHSLHASNTSKLSGEEIDQLSVKIQESLFISVLNLTFKIHFANLPNIFEDSSLVTLSNGLNESGVHRLVSLLVYIHASASKNSGSSGSPIELMSSKVKPVESKILDPVLLLGLIRILPVLFDAEFVLAKAGLDRPIATAIAPTSVDGLN